MVRIGGVICDSMGSPADPRYHLGGLDLRALTTPSLSNQPWRAKSKREVTSMPDSKCCYVCKTVYPLEMFAKDPTRKDGLQASCRQCRKKYIAAYRAKNVELVNMRNRKYTKSESGKRALRRSRAMGNAKDPRKNAARIATSRAILMGDLVRLPCQECGNQKSHAHHPDYDRPLFVVWLCQKHHLIAHGKTPRLESYSR